MKKTSVTFLFALFFIPALAVECPSGVPYEPESGLAGAGFREFRAVSELPPDWGVYQFRGASVPIPSKLASRIVLVGDEERVDQLYLQSEGSGLIWTADLSNALAVHGRTGTPIEALLKNGISGSALERRPMEQPECHRALASLISLDLLSDGDSDAAYELGPALLLNGRSWEGERWDIYWRNSENKLTLASWRLSGGHPAVLGHFDATHKPQPPDDAFQEFLRCVERRSPQICAGIELPGVTVTSNPSYLQPFVD